MWERNYYIQRWDPRRGGLPIIGQHFKLLVHARPLPRVRYHLGWYRCLVEVVVVVVLDEDQ